MTYLSIAFGGALGAVLRYIVGVSVAFPWGTLAVNVLGSFLMGVVFVAFARKGLDHFAPLIMVGLLGGFTTFSAFSLDTLKLVELGRYGPAAGYVVGSVLLSLIAIALGVALARMTIT